MFVVLNSGWFCSGKLIFEGFRDRFSRKCGAVPMFVDLHERLMLEWQVEGISVHEERHLRLSKSGEVGVQNLFSGIKHNWKCSALLIKRRPDVNSFEIIFWGTCLWMKCQTGQFIFRGTKHSPIPIFLKKALTRALCRVAIASRSVQKEF